MIRGVSMLSRPPTGSELWLRRPPPTPVVVGDPAGEFDGSADWPRGGVVGRLALGTPAGTPAFNASRFAWVPERSSARIGMCFESRRLPKPVIGATYSRGGHVAEWLRNGLQNRVPRFNSGRGLQAYTRASADARVSTLCNAR